MNKKGTILLLTLAFLALLSLNAVYFTWFVKTRINLWENQISYYKAYYLAMAGIDIGREILSSGQKSPIHLNNILSKEIDINTEEGTIKLNISDMDAKININSLIDKDGKTNTKMIILYKNLLANLGVSPDLSDVLLDWVDSSSGDFPRVFGAKKDYYQQLSPPYVPSNGPLLSTNQMYLMKGYTKDILEGSASTPGLLNFVTIVSDSKINVNTADPLILQSLGYSDDDVNQIVSERQTVPVDTGFLLNMDKNVTLLCQDIITTKSNYFQITSTAKIGNINKTVSAVVKNK